MKTDADPKNEMMSGSEGRDEPRLVRFVREKRRFFASRGATAVLVLALCLGFAAIIADIHFGFPPLIRAGWLLLMAVAAGELVRRLWYVRSHGFTEATAAREIEAHHQELGQLLRTSQQVADEAGRPLTDGISAALAAQVRRQAREALENTPLDGLIPWRTVTRLAATVLAMLAIYALLLGIWPDFRVGAGRVVLPLADLTYTCLTVSVAPLEFERGETVTVKTTTAGRPVASAVTEVRSGGGEWKALDMLPGEAGGFTVQLTGMTESFSCRVRAGDAVSKPIPVTLIDPPVVEQIRVTVASPAYTGQEPRESSFEKIRAVKGSRVTAAFTLNHALAEGTVAALGGPPWPVPAGAGVIEYDYDVDVGLSRFVMRGRDPAGWALEPVLWTVQGIPDHYPGVSISEPGDDPRVTRITEVPVEAVFSDDYGLAEARVILTVAGREKVIAREEFPAPGQRRARLSTVVRLEDFNVEVGSSVRLHAVARDFCPDHDSPATSEIRMIAIRPFRLIMKPNSSPESRQDSRETESELEALRKAVEEQKAVVADTLRTRETKASEVRNQQSRELARREEQTRENLRDLQPATPPTEQSEQNRSEDALPRALEQLTQAARELTKPDIQEALRKEDMALAAMMQARDEREQELKSQQQEQQAQADGQARERQQQRPEEPLTSLAERARELARQEMQLREQLARDDSAPMPRPDAATEKAAAEQAPSPETASAKSETSPEQSPMTQAQAEASSAAASSKSPTRESGENARTEMSPESPSNLSEYRQKQEDLAAQGTRLREDLAAHPETTALANRRMQDAAETMQNAARDLRENAPEQARNSMHAAAAQLERLAEHLDGLNPENVAGTLEQARDLTRDAARAVAPEQDQPASSKPSSEQAQNENSRMSEPVPEARQAETATESGQQPQSPSSASRPAAEMSARNRTEPRAAARPPGESRRDAEEDSRTVDDWMQRMTESQEAGDDAFRKRVQTLRNELQTAEMGDRIAQAENDRMRGEEQRATESDRQTADRLQELSRKLEQERRQAVQAYLAQLARAEAETRALQQQLREDPTDRPGSKGNPGPAERLEQLAGQLTALNDEKLEQLAAAIRTDIGPFNRRGGRQKGALIPESIGQASLPPAARRLRDLIDETIRKEFLLGRDPRIPEKYTNLVDTYFRTLSDEADQ